MKITYDPVADAVDIVLKKGKVAKTKEIAKEVYLDVDKRETPLSLEILGVSEKVSEKSLRRLTISSK